jgi:hypothetical protein
MTVFPKGKHDDQADSTAQFLDWFKTPIPGAASPLNREGRSKAADRRPRDIGRL